MDPLTWSTYSQSFKNLSCLTCKFLNLKALNCQDFKEAWRGIVSLGVIIMYEMWREEVGKYSIHIY